MVTMVKWDIRMVALIFNPVLHSTRKVIQRPTSKCPVRMFLRIHVIAVFVCIGIGIVPQFSLANSPNPGRDFLSIFRSNKSPAAKNEGVSNAASATSYHRLARTYADQNAVDKANTNYSLALRNAAPRQVAGIAADYAAFLTDTGNLHRAELMLRQALSQSPDDTEIIRMLARCLVRQEKIAEGLRHFRSIGTEAEARAEIAAIYREQGNTEMLAVAEQRWGTARPEATRPEPVRVAAAPTPRPATVRPETVGPEEPVRVAAIPRPATALPFPGTVRTLPPAPAVAVPREAVAIAAAPIVPPLSKSEFFDTRVPIPVPKSALPVMVAANSPRSALPAPAPIATQQPQTRPVLANPVRLATAPAPTLPKANEPPRPAVAIQPSRHYVVNAGTSTDLDSLLPIIRPATATVLTRGIR